MDASSAAVVLSEGMRTRILALLLLTIAGTAISVALAGQLAGLDGTYWSRSVAATTTTACVQDTTDAGTTCALFPAGTSGWQFFNVWSVKGRAGLTDSVTVCFTGTATGATVAAGAIATDVMTGAGGADCHTLESVADREDGRPSGADVRSRPGGRLGLCAGAVYSAGDRLYPPCSVRLATESRANAAECTAYGLAGASAACVGASSWTSDQAQFQGVVALIRSNSGTQNVLVTKRRVQER